MKNERNIYIDVVKGIAIILVVYGHCIEYYSKEYIYDNFFYSDIVHKIIYSFHMPLFMVISGYLFSGTIERYSSLVFYRAGLQNFFYQSLYGIHYFF